MNKTEATKRIENYRKQLKENNLRPYKAWILVGRIRELKEIYKIKKSKEEK